MSEWLWLGEPNDHEVKNGGAVVAVKMATYLSENSVALTAEEATALAGELLEYAKKPPLPALARMMCKARGANLCVLMVGSKDPITGWVFESSRIYDPRLGVSAKMLDAIVGAVARRFADDIQEGRAGEAGPLPQPEGIEDPS